MLFCFIVAAVKVEKSNLHHWDPTVNYSHTQHCKTWSSPSHQLNQQDHCKRKLECVNMLLGIVQFIAFSLLSVCILKVAVAHLSFFSL